MTENVAIWNDDRLGRKNDAALLYRLTYNRYLEHQRAGKTGSYVINVDAAWGQGKTFMLTRLHRAILAAEHPAVFIDAWQTDYIDDPYTLTVSAIDDYIKLIIGEIAPSKRKKLKEAFDKFRLNFGKIAAVVGTELTKTAARRLIGGGVETISEYIAEEDDERSLINLVAGDVTKSLNEISDIAIDKFARARLRDVTETKKSVANFKVGFAALLSLIETQAGKKLPFYVFIDELDRCKPTYAIAMLERIKHLFDVTGVVFILATDTEQLAHSINAVYGNKFDSSHYLQRFFNRSYQLPEADPYNIALDMILAMNLDIRKWSLPPNTDVASEKYYSKYLAKTSTLFRLSPRQLKQSMDILQDITTIWTPKAPIELTMMFPMICQYAKDRKLTAETMANIDRLLANSSHWIVTSEGGHETSFAEYYKRFREFWHQSLYEWVRNYSNATTLPIQAAYAYEYGKRELTNLPPNSEKATYRSVLASYGDIILNNRTVFYD